MTPSTPSRPVARYRGASESRLHQSRMFASLPDTSDTQTRPFSAKYNDGYTINLETPPSSTGKLPSSNKAASGPTKIVDDTTNPESHLVCNSDPTEDGEVFNEDVKLASFSIQPDPQALKDALNAISPRSSNLSALQQHPFESALYPPVLTSSPSGRSFKSPTVWGEQLLRPVHNGKLTFSEHVFSKTRPAQNLVHEPSDYEIQSRSVTALVTPHRRPQPGTLGQKSPAAAATAFATPSRMDNNLMKYEIRADLLDQTQSSPDPRHRRNGKQSTDAQRSYYQEQVDSITEPIPTSPIITVTADHKVIISDQEVSDNNAQKLLPAEYCLFAGNLPIFGTTDEIRAKLKAAVGLFGPVFVQIHADAAGRPYGHLQFITSAAKAGFFEVHMKSPILIDGRLIRLEETTAPRSVYVRTLDGSEIDVVDVKEFLATLGGTMVDVCFPNLDEVSKGCFQRADNLVFKFKNYGEYLQVRKALRDSNHHKYEFMFSPQKPAIAHRPKEKFNKSRLPCIVFVGNLDQNMCSAERLGDFFSYWGGIRHIHVVQNPHCRLPNPIELAPTHAWIDFYNHTDATRAVVGANNTIFFGRRLVVQPRAHARILASYLDRALNFLYSISPSTDAVTQAPRLGFTYYGRFFPF